MAVVARDAVEERATIDEVVGNQTICSVFDRTVNAHEDLPALGSRGPDGWEYLSWREYQAAVREATLALRDLGFGPGQFALIMARNRPEHVIADLAIVHAGGAAVSLYNTLAPEQVAYIANHCEATVAFVEDSDFLAKFESIRDELPHLRHIVLMSGEGKGVTRWDDLLQVGRRRHESAPDEFERTWRAVRDADVAALIYTSGTTGPPKGVMYTHRNVVWTCESSARVLDLEAGQHFLSYLPLSHVAERIATHWVGLYIGAVVHYVPDLAHLLPSLLEVRPAFFVGVPRVWEKFYAALTTGLAAEPDEQKRKAVERAITAGRELVRCQQRREEPPNQLAEQQPLVAMVGAALRGKIGLDRCQVAITSTAPLPVEVEEFFAAIGLPLIEVWGQSEVTGPATATPRESIRIGTVGVAYPGMEVKLADDGELLVRGGNVMAGYYRDPEKTAETIDAEGWVHTGDIGTLDGEGNFRIVDRKKEIIITSAGKNISPANIESLLKFHQLVSQACVIGDNRPYVTALLVLDPEATAAFARQHGIAETSPAQLAGNPQVVQAIANGVEEANSHLSRHEQVKKFTILPTEWTAESEELTPTLKLKRRVVAEKYRREIDAMYEARPVAPQR